MGDNNNIKKCLLDWVVVSFVLDDGAGREVEDSPERVPDPVGHCRVAGCAIPDGQNVLLKEEKKIAVGWCPLQNMIQIFQH